MALLDIHLLGSAPLRARSAEVTAIDDTTRRFGFSLAFISTSPSLDFGTTAAPTCVKQPSVPTP